MPKFSSTDSGATILEKLNNTIITVGTETGADYVCDGAADDVQIQAAVNEAAGGMVIIRKGTYQITNPIVLMPNTHLIGDGTGNTILQLTPSAVGNFTFNFMVNGRYGSGLDEGINCCVKDISFDGNFDNLTGTTSGKAGLVEAADGWVIENVEFMTTAYYKLFINGIDNVIARNCVFTGLTGNNADCIGGGNATNVTVINCRWVSGVNGNVFDHVNSSNIKFLNNKNYSARYAYFEGCTDSKIKGNVFTGGGGIYVQSDAGYSPANDTNPSGNVVDGNTITDASSFGIGLRYSSDGTYTHGGRNQIINNTILRAGLGGIVLFPGGNTPDGFDIISNNVCTNCNQLNVAIHNNGNGVVHPSGINAMLGTNIIVNGNICTDTQAVKTQLYGIEFGRIFSADVASPNYITCIGNDVQGNATAGINVISQTYTTVRNIYQNNGCYPNQESKCLYVKNTSGGDLVLGDVVTLKAVAAGNEVTTTTVQGDDLVFGVLAENIANNAYGHVQTLGVIKHLKVNGTDDIAIGVYLGTYTEAGVAMKAASGDMAFAIALEAYSTNDSNGVIDALIITPRKI